MPPSLGFAAYLEKPISDTDLLAAIERALATGPTAAHPSGC
jgi:FixJ family two-component response regulator